MQCCLPSGNSKRFTTARSRNGARRCSHSQSPKGREVNRSASAQSSPVKDPKRFVGNPSTTARTYADIDRTAANLALCVGAVPAENAVALAGRRSYRPDYPSASIGAHADVDPRAGMLTPSRGNEFKYFSSAVDHPCVSVRIDGDANSGAHNLVPPRAAPFVNAISFRLRIGSDDPHASVRARLELRRMTTAGDTRQSRLFLSLPRCSRWSEIISIRLSRTRGTCFFWKHTRCRSISGLQ